MNKYFTIILLVFFLFSCKQPSKSSYQFPFQNPTLKMDQRVEDLVSRLTLDQKIAQLMNQAPGIDSLGIPAYNWWSEGLHGVARAGLATVFPQAIGMAASWDENLIHRVASVISDEARAKHHEFVRRNKRFIYQGLTLWSPNINIFRDPRWGRGQETYGEDPFLTGTLGVQFIKGLQGEDPEYFKTIATVKHFAVHSGPEPERHEFDAKVGMKDLYETYLPQFEMGIKEGKAYSLMCAYNRLNGEACCGSSSLLNSILRKDWNFNGYVVSDCDAVDDIALHHKITATPEEAAALAIKSGTDLECGRFFKHLSSAVDKKLISETELDVALKRIFTARFKLGMFDDSSQVEWAKIPYSTVDQQSHRQLALEAARKSIVLLKNNHHTLPLKKDIKSIAVIGPNADQWLMLLGNYNGVPADPITPLRGIREKLPDAEVSFAQGCELADGMPMFYTIPAQVLFHGNAKGLMVEYFNNAELTGNPIASSVDSLIDVNWKDKAPRPEMDDDNFGVRWTGEMVPEITGTYQLGLITTCKSKLYLDDSLIAKTVYQFRDEFGDPRLRKSIPIHLVKGRVYRIKIDAGETFADAQVQLVWAAPKVNLKKQALAIADKAEVIVLCMGITPRMEGEEMDIKIDGFRGGDRSKLSLPTVQEDLIKSIAALGKPMVLVLMNGSALAINWEDQHLPAILEAWYPGQAAGAAIADVLFGDYNPGGKLPVTFYQNEKDLPPFDQYAMTSQTYRYFKGEALYPFGFGLSYTHFKYSALQLDSTIRKNSPVELQVNLTNNGEMEGEEVIQVYIKNLEQVGNQPTHSLKAYQRVFLKSGETKSVRLQLRSDAFDYFNEQGDKITGSGKYMVFVGGGQPNLAKKSTGNVLSQVVTID